MELKPFKKQPFGGSGKYSFLLFHPQNPQVVSKCPGDDSMAGTAQAGTVDAEPLGRVERMGSRLLFFFLFFLVFPGVSSFFGLSVVHVSRHSIWH